MIIRWKNSLSAFLLSPASLRVRSWNVLNRLCSHQLHENSVGRMCSLADASAALRTFHHERSSPGWSGIRNSELLRRAEAEFDLFITSDQSIRYQRNLAGQSIAILELSTNDIRRIRASASLIEKAVNDIQA